MSRPLATEKDGGPSGTAVFSIRLTNHVQAESHRPIRLSRYNS